MSVVLAVLAAVLAFGLWRGWGAGRLAAAAAVVLAVVLAVLVLAPASAVARIIGGTPQAWLVAGGVAALILGYRALLGWLRRRARPAGMAPVPQPAADDPLVRYARHIVLREIGGPGQARLRDARVLVVGAGGLGAPVCLYLAAAGVGRITVVDDDTVSLSNLQRQVIFRTADEGRRKAEAAADAMLALNPLIAVTPRIGRIVAGDAALLADHDLILDGTDSFASRDGINRACVAAGRPLLAGSIAQWEGQVTIYDPSVGAPCLACLFPEPPAPGLAPSCAEAGVVGPLPGVIGSLKALEAIKYLTGAGETLRGRMLIFDGLHGEVRTLRLHRDPACPVCAANATSGRPG